MPLTEYDDPRLTALYDLDNPDGPDHDFVRAVADELDAHRIADLGCGTGLLTVTLARPGRTVVGIDPAPAMLARAAARPGGEGVTWVHGAHELLEPGSADLVVMSGNVAMHILRDQWRATLASIARALLPGGRLVFETRNPEARAWLTWQDPGSERTTPAGVLRESQTTDPPDADGVVVMHCRTEFVGAPAEGDGDVVDVDQHLQFRDRATIEADLRAAGLRVERVSRDWARTPFTGGADQPLIVVEAARAADAPRA